jgi:hypothetical protein
MGWVIIDPTSSNNIDGGTDGDGDNPVDGEKPGDGEQDDEPLFKGQTIYVKPVDVWQVYNGETLYAKNEIDEAYGGIYLLLDEGYTYTVEVVGSRTDVGKTESQIISFTIFDPDGKEITPEELEIELVKETGLIRVVEDYVEVVICDISKVYDGQPLELEDFYYVQNEEDLISSGYWVYVYLDREIINCSDSISLSELQQMDNLVRVYDHLGNDVTHSFEIVITGEALFYYSFGMIGYAICEVLNKSFYALSDGKTPMVASIIGIAVNFVFAFLLAGVLKRGVGGLALASAVSSLAIALCLMVMINKRRANVINKDFYINLVKILVCAALAYLTAKALDIFAVSLSGNTVLTLIRLCICAIPSVVVYVLSAYLLKVNEIQTALNTFRKD